MDHQYSDHPAAVHRGRVFCVFYTEIHGSHRFGGADTADAKGKFLRWSLLHRQDGGPSGQKERHTEFCACARHYPGRRLCRMSLPIDLEMVRLHVHHAPVHHTPAHAIDTIMHTPGDAQKRNNKCFIICTQSWVTIKTYILPQHHPLTPIDARE